MENSSRYDRWWGGALIVLSVLTLGIVFFAGMAIIGEPGEYYDQWVAAEGPDGPESSFDWTSNGVVVEFVDTSSPGDGGIERWLWEFGDGGTSTEPNPSHRYEGAGEFTVTLDVVDANELSSEAEGSVEVEAGATNSGEGAIGLSDLADKLTTTAEDAAKGGGVVVLVVGLFLVLTLIGGRLLRQGVQALRPVPDRISVKLRPKQLDLAVAEARTAPSIRSEPSGDGRAPEREVTKEPVKTGA